MALKAATRTSHRFLPVVAVQRDPAPTPTGAAEPHPRARRIMRSSLNTGRKASVASVLGIGGPGEINRSHPLAGLVC
jgi:hypothetical protein